MSEHKLTEKSVAQQVGVKFYIQNKIWRQSIIRCFKNIQFGLMIHDDYDDDNNDDNDNSAITQLSTAHLKFCTVLSFPSYKQNGTPLHSLHQSLSDVELKSAFC